MTKSELIARLAERNPHLYQRDVERIVSTRLPRRWPPVTVWSCAASARFPSNTANPAPGATPAQGNQSTWRRNLCRSSKPVNSFANA